MLARQLDLQRVAHYDHVLVQRVLPRHVHAGLAVALDVLNVGAALAAEPADLPLFDGELEVRRPGVCNARVVSEGNAGRLGRLGRW